MGSCTDVCRSVLLHRLAPNSMSKPRFEEKFMEHKTYVFNLLKSTALNGENNSALVIGPRGSGKTAVSDTLTKENCNRL